MEMEQDFSELLASFNAQRVEYLIVGAWAVALHGRPRYTSDLDVLVRPERENAARVVAALDALGFESSGLGEDIFVQPDQQVQLGVEPVLINLLTSIAGVSWEEAELGSETCRFGEVPARFIGRNQLVASKRASGSLQDLADLTALGEA